MKTIVVTGVTGFIGKRIALFLLQQGYKVFGIGRTYTKMGDLKAYPNFTGIELDFEQYDRISDLLKGNRVDYFFHAAYRGVNGLQKSDYSIQIRNLDVSCTAVVQAVKMKCNRFVYIGSVDEFEAATFPDNPFLKPTHSRIYATIKYSSEVIGKVLAYEAKMEYVSALLALTYGEGNENNVLPHMIIKNSLAQKPIELINGDDYFDMIHISEAINGIWAVASKGKSYESYYVGHSELTTFKEIVMKISEIIGNTSPLNFGTYPDPSFSLDYKSIDREKCFGIRGFK